MLMYKMPIIEFAMLGIAAAGLLVSSVVATNTSTFLPDRLAYMKETIVHAYRKRKYRNYIRVSSSASPIPFAALCDWLSTGKSHTNGRQYLSMTLCNHNFTFCIPETGSDVLGSGCLIHLGGAIDGVCDYMYVYYQRDRSYELLKQRVLEPFASRLFPAKQA